MTLSLLRIVGMAGTLAAILLPSSILAQENSSSGSNRQNDNGQAATPLTPANEYRQQLQEQQQQIVAPQMPQGFPLAGAEQEYIEQLLAYWENYSSQVNRYRCHFTRWQYDHEVCNYRKPENNHLVAAMISRGKIRYSQPDQGMYEVNEKWQFAGPPDEEGGEPKYIRPATQKDNDFVETEKWICDGKKIYEYDYQNKRLYEFTLPPEAQGEGLKNSPLPFVFGAKQDELLDRFWIRDITPKSVEGQQYWLEAWPKKTKDAQAYSKVEIILSRDPFLPVAIHLYAPNYDPKTNPAKMVFQFEERQINGTLDGLSDWMKHFINPSTPFGWERVPRDLVQEPDAGSPRVGQNSKGQR